MGTPGLAMITLSDRNGVVITSRCVLALNVLPQHHDL